MITDKKLDLACGEVKLEGFAGIDCVKTSATDHIVDLQVFPWPIESESVEEIRCSHYIEHIPHLNIKGILKNSSTFEEFKTGLLDSKDGFIEFADECYRILKPGGKLTLQAPYYAGIRAFGDPTHERYICDWSFNYLSKVWRQLNGLDHYGIQSNFDLKYSYLVTNEMTLKSEEVRNKAFANDLNVIDDIIVELTKL